MGGDGDRNRGPEGVADQVELFKPGLVGIVDGQVGQELGGQRVFAGWGLAMAGQIDGVDGAYVRQVVQGVLPVAG